MQAPGPSRRVIRFGVFEADPEALELRKSGIKINLQAQPFHILLLLLERRGAILSREELQKVLWPNGTFVDFEHSVNAAVKRLRDALGDDADNPRFIETIPKRGYKFIAPIDGHVVGSAEKVEQPAFPRTRQRLLISAGALLILGVIVAGWRFWPYENLKIARSARLSFSANGMAPCFGFSQIFPAITTDGSRIYFSIVRDAAMKLAYVSVAGGEQVTMTVPLDYAELRHISPDGSRLLVYGSTSGEKDRHLWLVPTAGGGPRRFGAIDGHDGSWSPDGRSFLYAQGQALYLADGDANNSHELVKVPGKAFWLRWSPDATRIRFTVLDLNSNAKTLWECGADGSNLHRLAILWEKQPELCCGEWTQDGRHFVFRAFLDSHAGIWAITNSRFPNRTHKPFPLTNGPIDFAAAVPSHNGKQLFSVGLLPKTEVVSYNLKTRQARIWSQGNSPIFASTSRDGLWIAYVEERGKEVILWRSKPDGSERLQLSAPPLFAGPPRWSPDGTQIAFMGKMPDKPWDIYLVAVNGDSPRALVNDGRNAVDPEWSADGKALMFGRPPDYWAEANMPKAIYTLNLSSNEISKVPGSDGLYGPRWSADGRYVAALPLDEKKVKLFDFVTQEWKDFPEFPHIGNPQWSQNGEHLYVDGFDKEVVRIRRSDGKLERILNLKTADPSALLCNFSSVTFDGELLLVCNVAHGDIYALDVELP